MPRADVPIDRAMSGMVHDPMVEDQRFGATLRAVRVRRRLRQSDVAGVSRVSTSTVSRIERGHLDSLSLGAIRSVARAMDIRLDLTPRWRGGELDRLVNARHSALHETLAQGFRTMPAWTVMPEVSFSIFGERGVIDVLAWHEASRALLVVELKTDVVDV